MNSSKGTSRPDLTGLHNTVCAGSGRHSLWDLTWYKAHSISANLTPILLADSGLVPNVPEPQARLPSAPQHEHSLSDAPAENLAQGVETLPLDEGMQLPRCLTCSQCSNFNF